MNFHIFTIKEEICRSLFLSSFCSGFAWFLGSLEILGLYESNLITLTEFEVGTVSYGPSFLSQIYGPSAIKTITHDVDSEMKVMWERTQ